MQQYEPDQRGAVVGMIIAALSGFLLGWLANYLT